MNNFKKSLLAISVTAVLSACGGSSSGDGDADNGNGNSNNTFTSATISGVAAKGIVIGGDVVARELNADKSVKNANVGSAITNAKGAYSLVLNDTYKGGPIEIEISTNASSTVVCDVSAGCGTRTDDVVDSDATIDFGEKYKPGADNLTMTALLPDAADGEVLSVQITPFTHMAAKRALAGAALDSSAINNANSAVSQLLGGLDILTLEPVDITDLVGNENSSAVAYAALSASIAELAPVDASGQPDINAAITTLANNFSDGSLSAQDPGGTSDIALQEIINKAGDVFTQAGATDTSGVLNDLQTDVTNAGNGDVTPTPNNNAGDTDVEKAKAFLADLRTWGATIEGELDSPSAAFETQLDLGDAASDLIQDRSLDAIGYSVSAMIQFFAGEISSLAEFNDNESGAIISFSAGTLTKTATEITLTGGQITIDGVSVTVSNTLEAPEDGSSGTELSFVIKNATAEDAASRAVLTNGSIIVTLPDSYTVDLAALLANTAPTISQPTKLALNFDASFTQLKTLVNGQLVTATDPITFAATIATDIFTYVNNGDIEGLLPGSISATGSVSNTSGDSVDLSLSISIPTASTAVQNPVEGFLRGSTYADNNQGSKLVSWNTVDNVYTYSHLYNSFVATFNVDGSVDLNQYGFNQHYSGPYVPSENFFLENSYLLSNAYYGQYVEGQGYYQPADYSVILDFKLDGSNSFVLEESSDLEFFDASQPLLATVGLHFTVQFDGLPEAKVSVTGTSTAYEKGVADLSITYGTRKLQFIGSNNNAAPNEEAGVVEITNQDNIKLVLNPKAINNSNNEDVDVTINGKVIATIKEVNGVTRVEYIDGTFEIQ